MRRFSSTRRKHEPLLPVSVAVEGELVDGPSAVSPVGVVYWLSVREFKQPTASEPQAIRAAIDAATFKPSPFMPISSRLNRAPRGETSPQRPAAQRTLPRLSRLFSR